ncbi:lipoyl(octanoyl) transferase LipB [Leucobacter sp. GX24907]
MTLPLVQKSDELAQHAGAPTRTHREPDPSPVDIVVAGVAPDLVPYPRGLELQRQAADRVTFGENRGTALLLEHEAVYTAGRRSSPDEYPDDGSPVVPVDRGGRVTWHGPGQLVGYPVIRLREQVGVVDFVRDLEQLLIDVSAEFGVAGYRIAGRSGVWAHGATGEEKFAQIGLHAKGGLVTHGFALNCSNSLEPFSNFVPCGITDAGVASLSTLAGEEIRPADVLANLRPRLAELLEEVAA